MRLRPRQVVYAADQGIETALFPLDTLLSVVAHMRDGSTVEVGTIGDEGTAAVGALLGEPRSLFEYACEVAGTAIAIPVDRMTRILRTHDSFRIAAERFLRNHFFMLAQRSACHRLHTILQRSASWLLRSNDFRRDRIVLTHEHLAAMLGTRRPGVSIALAKLQKSGCITHGARYITIVDRSRLERLACECYSTINQQYRRKI